jgi:uncharacterized protein YjbJ (UPF0337 family)
MKNLADLQHSRDEINGKLKKTFNSPEDEDLLSIEGKKEELITRLQVRLGKTKDEILKIIYD